MPCALRPSPIPNFIIRVSPFWFSGEQQAQLCQQVAQGRFLTAREAADWVTQTFGVQYTRGSMYSLHSLGSIDYPLPQTLGHLGC
jgi:hypothetical protein